jgi:hypothetical protein
MNGVATRKTYLISQPFEKALKAVRETLARNEIDICMELDVTNLVERDLDIGFIPCRILLVESTCLLVEAATLDCSVAVLFPFHVEVTGRGPQTLVHWINPAVLEGAGLPLGAMVPLAKLESLVTRSLERIAMRHDIYEPTLAYTQ